MHVMLITSSTKAFEEALQTAGQMGARDQTADLAAPMNSFDAYVEEAWVAIDEALRAVFTYGKEKAGDIMDSAIATTEGLLLRAGSKARDLQTALLVKLQEFLQTLIQGTFKLIPTEYDLKGRKFSLSVMKCTQKLVMTGSLKVNLAEVFSLVSSGEIAIEAQYAEVHSATATS